MGDTNSIDMGTIITIIVVVGIIVMVAIFLVVQSVMSAATEEDTTVRDRLKTLTSRDQETYLQKIEKMRRQAEDEDTDMFTLMKEDFIRWIEPFSSKFYGKDKEKLSNKVKTLLIRAGEPDTDEAVNRFMVNKVALGVVLAGGLGILGLFTGTELHMEVAYLVVGMMVGIRYPEIKLKNRAKKRSDDLYRRFPDTLDLMVVCVEGGLGLDATIQRVGIEIEKSSLPWSQELRRITKELNAGLPRGEVYQNFAHRTDVEEIRSLCALLIQSEKLGTSISQVLRVYSEDVRIRRRQKAEELAYKASIKMTPVLVFLIFPPLFFVLVGPGMVRALKAFVFNDMG